SSRLQRIHPRPYYDCNSWTSHHSIPLQQPSPLIWYTSRALSQLKSHVRDQHHRL
ncbi:hypothetical protein AGABI2DRAFT_209977, partial [Agaricus bisporus var. bisporus H97]|uniref:hypothetical protein n=1 Tax=Agaricus bisporus var. bisporus (strain H97 / ATCC MYA-4626 / FGSC 10389) TaxID=936046 RepID=UPI00029F60AC